MTIKVYISGICGSQEVRKRQQRVLFILQSMAIDLQVIDVTEPGREEELTFMQEECKKHEKKDPLPPQIFNDNEYCGDYGDFQLANDDDVVLRFLKLESGETLPSPAKDTAITNGITDHEEVKPEIQENHEVPQEPSKDTTDAVPEIPNTEQNVTGDTPQEGQGKEESSEEEESEEEESEEESD